MKIYLPFSLHTFGSSSNATTILIQQSYIRIALLPSFKNCLLFYPQGLRHISSRHQILYWMCCQLSLAERALPVCVQPTFADIYEKLSVHYKVLSLYFES